MVPDKFDMVDMEGIDLLKMQGIPVEGLYDKLVESITLCRYQCLYNWKFNGILIPPTYVEMEVGENEEVIVNFGITVTPDDIIHLQTIEPGPAEPVIIPLLAEENMVYNVPSGVDGFGPVTVEVPSYTPEIESLNVSANGTYNAPTGVDGFDPVIVDVPAGALIGTDPPTSDIGSVGDYYIQETVGLNIIYGIKITVAARGTNYSFNYWGAVDIQLVFEDSGGNTLELKNMQNKQAWRASGNNAFGDISGVINGSFGTYYETSGLPGYFKISADVPIGFYLTKLKVCLRDNASYRDFWRSFTLHQWEEDRVETGNALVSVTDSVTDDWSWDTGVYTEFPVQNAVPIRVPSVYVYFKTSSGWVLLK